MAHSLTDLDLENAASAGKTLEIRGYNLTPKLQSNLERVLRSVLDFYEQGPLLPVVYAVVQELALWASLANMRQIFFAEKNRNLENENDLRELEEAFQASLTPESSYEYRRKIRAAGLELVIRIIHDPSGIRFEIVNNAIHSPPLEERLRDNLRRSMQYTTIMDYFGDHPDDQDGRNIGLAFSILMLKEQGLRPELMRLGKQGGGQVSRLEIPFDKSFQSIRDRIMNDETIRPFGSHDLIPGDVVVAEMTTVVCPICENIVDERIFFSDLDVGMVDEAAVVRMRPHWRTTDGACAGCIASYEPAEELMV